MTRPFALEDIARIITLDDVAVTPDGSTVVFTRVAETPDGAVRSLWTVSPGATPRPLTSGPADGFARIAPDGETVYFLRRVDGVPQIHRIRLDGGEAVAVTTAEDLPHGAGRVAISPDGERLAFAASVHAESPGPIIVDRLGHKRDGLGWVGAARRHLFVLDASGLRRLTTGDFDVLAPRWSPDGTMLAYTAAAGDDSDVTKTSAAWVVEADAVWPRPRRVGDALSVSGSLTWAPDGSAVFGVGTARPRVGNRGLLRLSLGGDTDRDVTAGLDRNVMAGAPAYPGGAPSCTADGDLLFCARERGATHLYVLRGDAASPEPLVAGPQRVVSALAVATEAPVAAFVLTTERSFGEIATVDVRTGEVAVLTDFTASAFEGVELATAEEREFEISDGTRVQAWLLSAPGAEGAAPLLLHVHGGPHNAWSGVADAVHLYQQVLAARGWRVLMVNPRGSDGFGDDFMRAVDGAWGKADAADFLEPLDQLVAEGIADPDRLAVTGYSYGGFMTCELTTRTDRFRAAVAGGLLCDFVPLAADGENATYFSRLTTGVDPTSGHERLAAASPITRVDAVKTPTLILHGDADELCPVSQAREWFSALRINGVPAQLAVYPGQSHLLPLSAPTPTRIDFTKRIVDWVERHTRVRRAVPADPRVSDAAHWQRRLDELARLHGVVGAQFGIVELDDDGDVLATTRAASGVLDASTGQPATLDSVFQIGSITKVWTAILVMQLVDEGLLDLDAPVRSVLPDFTTADPESSERITVRHLLTHTSGMDGDLFTNTGRGDDCVERYVASLSTAAQITPVGERFSYCNSGFVLAGRIVEALRDTTWDEALRRWIIEPLGLTQTVTLLDDVPRFATATGHTGAGALAAPVPVWPITRSMGPAGLIDASVGDLLTFAAAAMRGGVAPNGTRILSEAAHHAMLEEQVSLRDAVTSTAAWSLGWFLQDWNGRTVYGHDGGTIGQRAYLRILPGARTAIALLTTGGHADGLYHDLFAEAAQLVDGTVIADPLAAGDRGGDAPLGEYRTAGTHVLVAQKESGFQLEVTPLTDLLRTGEAPPATLIDLVPSDVDGVWAFTTPDLAGWSQFRPVPGGAYMGYRFLPAVAPS